MAKGVNIPIKGDSIRALPQRKCELPALGVANNEAFVPTAQVDWETLKAMML